MAATERTEYGRGAVYGSLAYDFNNPELYTEEEYSRLQQPEPREETKARAETRAQAAAAPRSVQGISPFAVLGVAVCAFLSVIAITSHVGLVRISGESVELQARLAELEKDRARLQIAYESSFNLAEIEEYAIETLGMQKPIADQVTYIDTSAPDRAVVVGEESDSFVDRTADFLSDIGSYFR